MGLEDKVENEINYIEAAKIIRPYLKVDAVKPKLNNKLKYVPFFIGAALVQGIMHSIEGIHTAYLFCTSRERYQEKKEYEKSEKQNKLSLDLWREKREEEFQELLLKNDIDEHAYLIAQDAGIILRSIIFHADRYKTNLPIEITKSKPDMQYVPEPDKDAMVLKEVGRNPTGIRMQKQSFESILEMAIKDGIYVEEDHFYGNIPGFPDHFNNVALDIERTKKGLLDRIYQKCEQGKTVTLLEHVEVRIGQEYVYMEPSYYYAKKRLGLSEE